MLPCTTQVVRMQPCFGTSGQKSHAGRWRGMDAGVDSSDDQVCLACLTNEFRRAVQLIALVVLCGW